MKRMITEKLLQQLKDYEGRWVALSGPDDAMIVVASGDDAAEASEQAEESGYKDVTLMKVLPSGAAYVPHS